MLLQFSDTTNKKGIFQKISRMCKTTNSTSSYPIADVAVDVNLALAHFFLIAEKAQGRWQVDDDNHTDYPIIYTDLVNGQQDYTFTTDENGNRIHNVYKVRIKDPNGDYVTLKQRDLQDGEDTPLNDLTQGTPTHYDITANGIMLTPIPNYDQDDDGVEIYISRAGSYFSASDTTKVAGLPDVFQEYLCLRPAYFYCANNGLPMAAEYKKQLYGEDGVSGMEGDIRKYYSRRNRDERPRLATNYRGSNSNR